MTTLIIIAAIIALLIAVYFLIRKLLRKVIHDFQNGRVEMQQSADDISREAKEIARCHKALTTELAHIQPGKMYKTLGEFIPKLENNVQIQEQVNHHENRLTYIEQHLKINKK